MKILNLFIIVVFFSSLLLISCETKEDGFFRSTQVSAILSANVPDTMQVGETYTLEITYQKDSDCHQFSNFEAVNEGDSLYYVRAITIFTEAVYCNQEAEEVLREVDFINNFESNFTFKFLKGIDSLGDFTYVDKDIVVNE